MSARRFKIGLLTGGGDCPGLNAVIRAVVKRAVGEFGWEVVGIENGFKGLVEPGLTRPLSLEAVRGILPRGGTILGTSNRANPFAYAVREEGKWVEQDLSKLTVQRIEKLGIEALLVAGGDGTLSLAHRLAAMGVNVVGIPKTIDNDLAATDQTFGFDTARYTATDAVDKLHTTGDAHDRVMICEVMGRHAGFLALHAGVAGGADAILVPEIPYRVAAVVDKVKRRRRRGRSFSVVVVAEGAVPEGGGVSVETKAEDIPGRGVALLGGAGKRLASQIEHEVELETRVTVLGHLQRGGTPTPYDRMLGTMYGWAALDLVAEGRYDRMVALHGDRITDVAIAEAVDRPKHVERDGQLARAARSLGVTLGE
jgi:6-phosphofructokinase 1